MCLLNQETIISIEDTERNYCVFNYFQFTTIEHPPPLPSKKLGIFFLFVALAGSFNPAGIF